MSDAQSDPARAYEVLRSSTAALLGYDLTADLPLTQSLQVDLVSLLRLEVDTLQGKVLAGEAVDLNRLSVAYSMLAKILPPAALEAEPPPKLHHPSESRRRLQELVESVILSAEPSPNAVRVAELEAENERLREALARAGVGVPPPLLALPPPAAPSADVVSLRPASASRQAEPPPQQPPPAAPAPTRPTVISGQEPWRSYVTGDIPRDLYWTGAWGRRSW